MTQATWFSSKTAIIIASIMLAGYLFLILTVIHLGRDKLEKYRYNELHLKINQSAESLSNYFDLSQRNLSALPKSKVISAFFANKNSGMSMRYGLGSSLFNVQSMMLQLKNESVINHNPIYSRISLLLLDGSIIADTATTPFYRGNINLSQLQNKKQTILIDAGKDLRIRLSNTVYFQQKPIAILISELNNVPIIQQLTSQNHQDSGSRVELSSQFGSLLIWDSLEYPRMFARAADSVNSDSYFYLKQPIKNTPLTLNSWYEPDNIQNIFTSKYFAFTISLLAIPVFLGLYYFVRVERKNTLLQTEILHSKQKHEVISSHNLKLEKEVKKRKASERKLAHQATYDPLTGLANRNHSMQQLNHAIDRCQRRHQKVLIMSIDLDNFKQINDTLGHAAGDIILQKTSERLIKAVRKTDTVARLSGDEFLLIIPDLKDKQQAALFAVKILSLFEQPFEMNKYPFYTSTSIGLATYPDDGKSPETLLKSADLALYRVKNAGRNGFSFYDEKMNDQVNRKVAINRRLRHAIKHNVFEMYYQPVVDLNTKKIIGAEALIRWTDFELGFVPPDEFIAIAEKNGLIQRIGSFALYEATQQAAKWQSIMPLQIAINFSSVQFRDCRALLNEIKAVLSKTGLPADKLDMEVTESLLINQGQDLLAMLKSLRDLGIGLSIDDFGTGYSALSYLQKFSFSKLKIDRAFIINLAENKADKSLVTAILAMAKALNLKVVAEGIEDASQLQFLTQQQCEYGQGYLFSKPVTAAEFEKLLRDDQAKTSLYLAANE